jgi:hypothetical protein
MIMKKKHVNSIIDTARSGDNRLITNEGEKISKYKNLTTEIQLIRNVKMKVISITRAIWATGIIQTFFRK